MEGLDTRTRTVVRSVVSGYRRKSATRRIGIFIALDDATIRRLRMTVAHLKKQMDRRFTRLQREMNARFVGVDRRFISVDDRFDAVDQRFDGMDRRVARWTRIRNEIRGPREFK